MAQTVKNVETVKNAGNVGWIPGSGRAPGEGNSYSLQYSCLENSRDRGAWQAPWGHKDSDVTNSFHFHQTEKRLSVGLGEGYGEGDA